MSDSSRLQALIESNPELALKLANRLSAKVLVPHSEGQKDVLDHEARFGTLCAGRRWGKTRVGAARALRKARKKESMVWWVAPTYKIVKRGYREVLRQLPDGVLSAPAPRDSAFDAGRSVILQFKWGARMEFYSAERPEGMLGEGVDYAILDEAATMPSNTWDQIVRPTLADRAGGALLISTPRGRNWFYSMFQRGQDLLQKDYRSWQFPSMTNPTIPQSEWEEMEATLPRAIFEQEVLAQFISDASAVFRLTESAYKPFVKPDGHVVVGVDLAKHHDFSVYDAANAGSRLPCKHVRHNHVSWPEQRQRLHNFVAQLHRDGAESVTVVLDSTGLGDVVYDDLCFEGLDAVPVKFTPQWKQQAVMLLGADLERQQAYIHEEQRQEFESYAYKINTNTGRWSFEAPDNGHDDEVSAKLLQHWGLSQVGVPDVKVLSALEDFNEGIEDNPWDAEGDAEEIEEAPLYLPAPPTVQELLQRRDVWG